MGKVFAPEKAGDLLTLGDKGLVGIDGEVEHVQEIAESELAVFAEKAKGMLGKDAFALFRGSKLKDWSFSGPRAVKEFLGATFESLQWVRKSGVNQHTSVCHEHRNLIECLRLAVTKDQLDPTNLMSFELMVRRVIQLEVAVARNANAPDYSGCCHKECRRVGDGQAQGAGPDRKAGKAFPGGGVSVEPRARPDKPLCLATVAATMARQSFDGGHPWAKFRAHGDPFPLNPRWLETYVAEAGIPFPRRGGWTADALNSLALHGANSDKLYGMLQGMKPTMPQMQVGRRVAHALEEAGPPPAR